MSLQYNIFVFTLAGLSVWMFLGAILPFLRKNLLDTPNQRSSHKIPVPRGGGIAFVLIGSIMHVAMFSGVTRWIPVICFPLAIVGLIDDHKDLPASWRYMIQFLTATALIIVGKIPLSTWTVVILVIIITAIINFTNFMDGLDGLVAGCGVVLMATTSSWALSGAIFGFLLWNWSPARVFMGDVGSTFIGAVFCGLVLQEDSYPVMIQTLLIGFPIFGDAAVCVLRRCIGGEPIFKAHRKHLFQRLHQAGWNHRKVASMYILGIILLWVASKIGGPTLLTVAIASEGVIAFYLDTKVAAKFVSRN
jgi:UDP-N-acetylmuramyl pentapeptide phosphotransferase/UDP-N-acetylglucosamine-1-phosphate transferase